MSNIIPMGRNQPLSTADRLYALAKKAELDPAKYKYMLAMTASSDLGESDWAMAGHPSPMMLMGLIEMIKVDLQSVFDAYKNEK